MARLWKRGHRLGGCVVGVVPRLDGADEMDYLDFPPKAEAVITRELGQEKDTLTPKAWKVAVIFKLEQILAK